MLIKANAPIQFTAGAATAAGLLAVVLFAASRTVTRDVEALRGWWGSRVIAHIFVATAA